MTVDRLEKIEHDLAEPREPGIFLLFPVGTVRPLVDELRAARLCIETAREILTNLPVEFDHPALDYLAAQIDKGDLLHWKRDVENLHRALWANAQQIETDTSQGPTPDLTRDADPRTTGD